MKRFTAVFLAALGLFALPGCGLEADETIDENGNVRKLTAAEQSALVGTGPVVNPDTESTGGTSSPIDILPPLPGTSDDSESGGGPADPTIALGDGAVALPQDPIPLVDPAKPGHGPNGGPRVNPLTQF